MPAERLPSGAIARKSSPTRTVVASAVLHASIICGAVLVTMAYSSHSRAVFRYLGIAACSVMLVALVLGLVFSLRQRASKWVRAGFAVAILGAAGSAAAEYDAAAGMHSALERAGFVALICGLSMLIFGFYRGARAASSGPTPSAP